jgi:hypothetical protein
MGILIDLQRLRTFSECWVEYRLDADWYPAGSGIDDSAQRRIVGTREPWISRIDC